MCGIINTESEVSEISQDSKPRPPSKRERAARLLELLQKWQSEGDTPEQAIERLTISQYDFLIDYGINLDDHLLTAEQQKAVSAIVASKRPSGLVYNKKYPQDKQDLYNILVATVEQNGAEKVQRHKNFRDLDFEIKGVKYKLVLSNPRTPKN